jgi:uncharacterized protein YoxC
VKLDVYFHFDPIQVVGGDIDAKLDQILTALGGLREEIETMTPQIQSLIDDVTILKGQAASVIGLVEGLAAAFEAIKDDPAAIQAQADEVRATADALAAAVAAHPLPVPPEPPTP